MISWIGAVLSEVERQDPVRQMSGDDQELGELEDRALHSYFARRRADASISWDEDFECWFVRRLAAPHENMRSLARYSRLRSLP